MEAYALVGQSVLPAAFQGNVLHHVGITKHLAAVVGKLDGPVVAP